MDGYLIQVVQSRVPSSPRPTEPHHRSPAAKLRTYDHPFALSTRHAAANASGRSGSREPGSGERRGDMPSNNAAVAVLGGTAVLSTVLAASRGARLDPVEAIRAERS